MTRSISVPHTRAPSLEGAAAGDAPAGGDSRTEADSRTEGAAAAGRWVQFHWHSLADAALAATRCLLLVGPSGSGKSAFLRRASRARRGCDPVVVQGTVEIGQQQLWSTPGAIPMALGSGRDLLFEDLHQVPPEVRVTLLGLREDSCVAHPYTGEEWRVHPGFRLLATSDQEALRCRRTGIGANTLLDGFLVLEVPEPTVDELRAVLRARFPAAGESRVDWALDRWSSFRELARSQCGAPLLGLRSVAFLMTLLERGVEESNAVQLALVHRFVLEPELHEAAKLQWSFEV